MLPADGTSRCRRRAPVSIDSHQLTDDHELNTYILHLYRDELSRLMEEKR